MVLKLHKLHNPITSSVFDWSTRVADGQTGLHI